MRIIDKNKDYYDYIQFINDNDDFFVWDRGMHSFMPNMHRLTHAMFQHFVFDRGYSAYARNKSNHYDTDEYVLMRAGYEIWIFRVQISTHYNTLGNAIGFDEVDWKQCYHWTDYKMKPVMFEMSYIDWNWRIRKSFAKDDEVKTIQIMSDAIRNKNYAVITEIGGVYRDEHDATAQLHIPILKETPIPSFVDAAALYNAIESYFAYEKTESERTVAVGTTNEMKIEMHGFDTKISFRGKNK